MIRSMFSGVSGLRAHQSKMDTIGNNVANVNTFGYKASRATFQDSIYQTMSAASNGGNTYGGKNASQVGYGSKIGSIDLMFSQGSYAPTDSPTDCMIDGGGFFVVGPKVKDGEDGLAITDVATGRMDSLGEFSLSRMGDFKFDGDGYLVDSNANIVYGYARPGKDAVAGTAIDKTQLRPIRIPKAAVGDGRANINSIRIDATGNVIGIEGKDTIEIGQIMLANMTNPNGLEKSKGPYYRAVSNVGTIVVGEPGDRGTGQVMSNGLEMANVDLAKEFSEMITTQRGFQANTRIITVSDEMLQELLSMKR